MTSAAGVRYGVGKLRLSRFQKCAVRRLPNRKSSSILQLKTNVQYSTLVPVDWGNERGPARADDGEHSLRPTVERTAYEYYYIRIPSSYV